MLLLKQQSRQRHTHIRILPVDTPNKTNSLAQALLYSLSLKQEISLSKALSGSQTRPLSFFRLHPSGIYVQVICPSYSVCEESLRGTPLVSWLFVYIYGSVVYMCSCTASSHRTRLAVILAVLQPAIYNKPALRTATRSSGLVIGAYVSCVLN